MANNFTVCGSHSCLLLRNKIPWLWFLTTSDIADSAISSGPGSELQLSKAIPITEQSCMVGPWSATLYVTKLNSYTLTLMGGGIQLS